ncbi:hypothetical protein BURPS1106B_A1200 [Burkholderia pseudomallei 1106b]|uniref:Uncharacterized protein n=1 Tax=Burkholderia pseudomallei (strain 1106a) TaxID=357348 RepID=A3NV57_BURP0|nr:hypothetical protein BURPS1106A_1963 [Burkholderia pseudomallei 1106a]EBA51080.1 hypothetical protein BURPS305_6544 [Burkholderia pseudomallei 305]EES25134.1 hypothetical protein BURPS1106B_A1200 [Burkholderia pseudomallei 1106b]
MLKFIVLSMLMGWICWPAYRRRAAALDARPALRLAHHGGIHRMMES